MADNDQRPLMVSIITPSYNQGVYLEDAIRSVLSQEGDFYLDYIIQDAASTDNSVSIIKKYDGLLKNKKWQIKCKGIEYRWSSKKDKGQADAIKKGFYMAKGEILAWLNSDDVYEPLAIKKALDAFSRNPDAAMAYGRSYYIDANGDEKGEYPASPFDMKKLAVFNFISQPSVFFRRKAYEKSGMINEKLRYAMDYDLWIRLSTQGSVVFIDEPLSRYRMHEESKTMSGRLAIENTKESLDVVMRHFNWAPLGRVFIYSYYLLKSGWLGKVPFLLAPASALHAAGLYLKLNKGVRIRDLRAITASNLRKAAKGRRF